MRHLPDRWCEMTPRGRGICWASCTLIMLLAVTMCQPKPTVGFKPANNQALWVAARDVYSPMQTPFAPASGPFSPLNIHADGLRLVRWQPDKTGGELAVEASWAQIPGLFTMLADSDVVVQHFSVQAQDATLMVVMQLEQRDAG